MTPTQGDSAVISRRTVVGMAAAAAALLATGLEFADAWPASANVAPLWPTGSTTQPPITDGYGWRPPINGSRPFHYGVDISMGQGEPVQAALDGTVIYSDVNGTLGEQVVLQTTMGQFLYPHMQVGTRVPLGAFVPRGGTVGLVGITGNSTGHHVCFRTFAGSWRNDADARDPTVFMTGNSGTAPSIEQEGDMSITIFKARVNGVGEHYFVANAAGVHMSRELSTDAAIRQSEEIGVTLLAYISKLTTTTSTTYNAPSFTDISGWPNMRAMMWKIARMPLDFPLSPTNPFNTVAHYGNNV